MEKKIKVCPECGNAFIPKSKMHKYCSEKCSQHHYYVTKTIEKRNEQKKIPKIKHIKIYKRICPHCGQEFETQNIKQIFCSYRCGHPLKEKIKKICPFCGKEFETSLKHKRFCSAECYTENIIKKSEAKFGEKICVICGKTFTGFHNSKYCSEECLKEKERRRAKKNYYKSKK